MLKPVLISVGSIVGLTNAFADDKLTKFTPDVVFECKNPQAKPPVNSCEFHCFALRSTPAVSTPSGNPPGTSPLPGGPGGPGTPGSGTPTPPSSGGPSSPIIVTPAGGNFTWSFERLEFFSKAGHSSENWLAAIKGLPGSYKPPSVPPVIVDPPPGLPPPSTQPTVVLQKAFVTLGRTYMCTYEGKTGSTVELIKYYELKE